MNFRPPNLTQTDPSCILLLSGSGGVSVVQASSLYGTTAGTFPNPSVNYTGIGMGSLGDQGP